MVARLGGVVPAATTVVSCLLLLPALFFLLTLKDLAAQLFQLLPPCQDSPVEYVVNVAVQFHPRPLVFEPVMCYVTCVPVD